MTILEILQLGAGDAFGNLDAVLQSVADGGGHFAPEAATLRTKLNDAVGGADLAAVAAACSTELADVAKGHFHPRRHPSDGA